MHGRNQCKLEAGDMIFGEYRLCELCLEHRAVYVFEPVGEDLARMMRQEIQDLQGEGLTLGKNLGSLGG